MNYFDDVGFLSVDHVVSRSNGKPSTPHVFWGIGIMLGDGYVKISGRSHETKLLKMPFLYLIRPNPEGGGFWGSVDGTPRDNRWFTARGPRMERLVDALSEKGETEPPIQIHLKSYQELIHLHDKMLHLFQHNIPSKAYHLAVCLEEFAGAVYDALADTRQNSPVFDYVAKIAEMISSDPGAEYDFPLLAQDYRISYDHFRRCFLEYAGKPLYEFLLEKRLTLADSLLRESRCSIKEISERCGFSRQAEFARFVKKRTGLTPSELRKKPSLDSE